MAWALAGRAVGGRTARAVARRDLLVLVGLSDGGHGPRAWRFGVFLFVCFCVDPAGLLGPLCLAAGGLAEWPVSAFQAVLDDGHLQPAFWNRRG